MKTLMLCAAAALSVSTLALGACSARTETAKMTSAPASIDRMPKDEVEAIVHDYLMKNPQVLVDAFQELDRRHGEEQFAKLVSHDRDPSIGPKNAPITIVEFFDYNCGYCKAANEWVMNHAADRNGQVRIVFKEFPILRQSSELAAKAALAANKQGKYRDMHIALMKSRALAPTTPEGKEDLAGTQKEIDRVAKSVGLDLNRLHKDMESDAFKVHIEGVHREAQEAGIDATPGFFVNGQMLAGFSEKQLDEMITKAKAAKKT